jgi:uncharacterized protein
VELTPTVLWLIAGAFSAGLVDSVVGGGGLIQIPLLMSCFPDTNIAVLFGTNKLVSAVGTASAAYVYTTRVTVDRKVFLPACFVAALGSIGGAAMVSHLSNAFLKPFVLAMLLTVAAYTVTSKGFSNSQALITVRRSAGIKLSACLLGIYDGFFGPGTGSFLMFSFVRIFGIDILEAAAAAKWVNLATNCGALVWFVAHEGVLWGPAAAMAVFNVVGAQVGSRLALRAGVEMFRWALLAVVLALSVRLALDYV